MAETHAQPGLTPQIWDDKFFREYVRDSRFRRYMGTSENSIIQIKDDLSRKRGDSATFATTRKLTGSGVTGNQVLEGNEEEVDSRSLKVTVDVLRHAVKVTDWDEQKSSIDLRDAGRMALKDWSMEKLKTDIIDGFNSINGVKFEDANAAARNAYLVDNADRVLFGAARSNNASNNFANSLANIDNSSDKLTCAQISLAKRMAQLASPAIRPIRLSEDEEWFVMFANSLAFRDLSTDPVMTQANREVRQRGMNNPLFTGGSLVWDGVIIREIPEIPFYASSIQVGPNFLCGAQSLGIAWARRPRTTTDVRDYGFRHGVGIAEIRGVDKLIFGKGASDTDDLVQHGMVTVWSAAVADA